jgi:tRNA pseudouridine32 synthase/23S rRNA pseudouridine746 synthase
MGRSRLYLRKLDSPPATILEHLVAHFPRVPEQTWRERVARGVVTLNGKPIEETSPYRHGLTVEYEREVHEEPAVMASESILYQDDEILVADKPHGMPVTPAGDYVQRSLLFRLQQRTGLPELSPAHRLDRETAGLVLFSVKASSRARYHRLFAKNLVEREYMAVASLPEANQKEWILENRIVEGSPWFTQKIVEGPVNAITKIELVERRGELGLFRLRPSTGKQHQLRLHMSSIGAPIVGDPYYPEVREKGVDEPPLQLLACRLAFEGREFTTPASLSAARLDRVKPAAPSSSHP